MVEAWGAYNTQMANDRGICQALSEEGHGRGSGSRPSRSMQDSQCLIEADIRDSARAPVDPLPEKKPRSTSRVRFDVRGDAVDVGADCKPPVNTPLSFG